jgi:hypothetical protein
MAGNRFTIDFVFQVRKRLGSISRDFMKDFLIEIDGEFSMPPLLDVVRYLTEMGEGAMAAESKAMVTKQAVLGKKVTISHRGRVLGAFTMNSLTDPFDGYDVLRNNPAALMLLMEIATTKMVEKSLPPQVASDPPVAAAEQGGSQKSSGGTSAGS